MGRDKAFYAKSKRGGLVCAMQSCSPRLWPTNWRASTFVCDKLGRQFMQRCARGFHTHQSGEKKGEDRITVKANYCGVVCTIITGFPCQSFLQAVLFKRLALE